MQLEGGYSSLYSRAEIDVFTGRGRGTECRKEGRKDGRMTTGRQTQGQTARQRMVSGP